MLFIVMLVLSIGCVITGAVLRSKAKAIKAGRETGGRYHDNAGDYAAWSWVALGSAAWFFLVVITCFFAVIPTGSVGVQTVFGKIQDRVVTEGLQVKNPLAHVTKMTARTQSYTMSIKQGEGEQEDPDMVRVLSKDNLEMDMDLTVLYSLYAPDAQKMYKVLGSTEVYTEAVVRPTIRRAIRDVASQFNAAELMSSARSNAEKGIFTEMESSLANYFKSRGVEKGINVEAVLLRNVQPPATLKAAIEDKLTKQQQKEGMEFVLDTERKMAEQRVIQARGLADSQAIIDKTLTPEYLQFKYIEALEKLVNSPNNTILVLPFDQKLTPLINIGNK